MKVCEYYGDWEREPVTCGHCGWSGTGAECTHGEIFSEVAERDCPRCYEPVIVLAFPTIEESRANWDKVSPGDRAGVELRERFLAEIERRALKSTDQLPDLEGDDIVLVWDAEDYQRGGDTLIRHGSEVIWREPAQYEGYERFIEVANLLKQKYGDRLQDLVPSRNSELYLYGDKLASPSIIRKFREELGLYPNQKAMRGKYKRNQSET